MVHLSVRAVGWKRRNGTPIRSRSRSGIARLFVRTAGDQEWHAYPCAQWHGRRGTAHLPIRACNERSGMAHLSIRAVGWDMRNGTPIRVRSGMGDEELHTYPCAQREIRNGTPIRARSWSAHLRLGARSSALPPQGTSGLGSPPRGAKAGAGGRRGG